MSENAMLQILKKYGIFLGLLVGFGAFLLCATLLARPSWKKGLLQNAQYALDYYYPDSYTVGQLYELDSVFSTNAIVFAVKSKRPVSGELFYYGVVVRIPSIVGAEPALFLYNEHNGAHFVGYTITLGKAELLLNAKTERSSIRYWEKQLPLLLQKAGI